MLHAVGGRSGECAPCGGGVRGPARCGDARDRRQDVRHAASDRGETRARLGRGGRHMSALANEYEAGDDQAAIREGVRAVVTRFGDDYWLARDDDGKFPFEFHRAMADAGWLGITMPEEYGGSGLGVTEAAIMMHEVASQGGGMSATASVHINLFGPYMIVVTVH